MQYLNTVTWIVEMIDIHRSMVQIRPDRNSFFRQLNKFDLIQVKILIRN